MVTVFRVMTEAKKKGTKNSIVLKIVRRKTYTIHHGKRETPLFITVSGKTLLSLVPQTGVLDQQAAHS